MDDSLSAPSHLDVPVIDLLGYYKSQVQSFVAEREDYLAKLEQCAVSRKDYFKLRWEITQREIELTQIQKEVSDAHIFLYDERQHVMELHAENNELKCMI